MVGVETTKSSIFLKGWKLKLHDFPPSHFGFSHYFLEKNTVTGYMGGIFCWNMSTEESPVRFIFFSIRFFFGDLNLDSISKLPRNNTAFWNLFSGNGFFLGFLLLKLRCWNCKTCGVFFFVCQTSRGWRCLEKTRCLLPLFVIARVSIHPLILEASDRVVEKFSASDEAWRSGTPNQERFFGPERVEQKCNKIGLQVGSHQLDVTLTLVTALSWGFWCTERKQLARLWVWENMRCCNILCAFL